MFEYSKYAPSLVAIVFVLWNARERRAPARQTEHGTIVEYPLPLRVLGVIGCLGLVALIARDYSFFISGYRGPALGAIYLCLLAGIALLTAYFWRSRIVYGPESVAVFSLWRRRTIPRNSLRPAYGGFWGWVVETDGCGRFGFNPQQRGCAELLTLVGTRSRGS